MKPLVTYLVRHNLVVGWVCIRNDSFSFCENRIDFLYLFVLFYVCIYLLFSICVGWGVDTEILSCSLKLKTHRDSKRGWYRHNNVPKVSITGWSVSLLEDKPVFPLSYNFPCCSWWLWEEMYLPLWHAWFLFLWLVTVAVREYQL